MIKNKNIKKSKEFQEIYGTHSVLAALKNPKRKHFSIYIIEKYKELIGKYSKNIGKINILNNTEMTKLFGSEKVNQGIVLKSSPLPVKQFNEIFKIEKLNEISVVVVLDNITDPYILDPDRLAKVAVPVEIISPVTDNVEPSKVRFDSAFIASAPVAVTT